MPLSDGLRAAFEPEITQAFVDLKALGEWGGSTPLHKCVGWGISPSAILMGAPLRLLNGGMPLPYAAEDDGWLVTMQVMHRAFLTVLHAGIDAALQDICTLDMARLRTAREKAAAALTGVPISGTKRRTILARTSQRLGFTDYLEHVLTEYIVPERRNEWRAFFRALTIARNQAAHHTPAKLEPTQVQVFETAGLADMLRDGEFTMSPIRYAPLARRALAFMDEVVAANPALGIPR